MTFVIWILAAIVCIAVMVFFRMGGLILMFIGAIFLVKSCVVQQDSGSLFERKAGDRDAAERALVVVNNVTVRPDGLIAATLYNGSSGRIHSPRLACIIGGPTGTKAIYTIPAAVIVQPKEVQSIRFFPQDAKPWPKDEKFACVADFDYMLFDGIASGAIIAGSYDGNASLQKQVEIDMKVVLDPPHDTLNNAHDVIVEGTIKNKSDVSIKGVQVTCLYDSVWGDYRKITRILNVYVRPNETKPFSGAVNRDKVDPMKVRGARTNCLATEYIPEN